MNRGHSSTMTLDPEASLPPPRITWTGAGTAAGLWVLYTLLLSIVVAQAEGAPLVGALIGQSFESLIMALASVPVWWIVVRWMDERHWGWIAVAHLVLGPLYTWGTVKGFIGLVRLGGPDGTVETLMGRYPWLLVTHGTLYVIQFAIYHLVRSVQRLRLKEQQAIELRAKAREQELAALKAQVNPHFLFNTLNSISATLRHNPEQAREMIAKLSGMMRYALNGSDRDHVPLRDEIDFTRRYLDLEHHRFSDRLTATIEVDADDETLDTPVPPMILQPLVENALRHGIAPSEEGGTVTVEVTTENDRIHVRVEDTGVGPGEEDPLSADDDSTGLPNTDTRLRHTYGPDAGLHTAENTPTGFTVHFSIPRNGVAPN
ncbi:MAG: sensor histidine kinase [Salinibacter sp.]|uniref:sensor histidine kinase n=1 Tax=Salinibacter sp. TaxID=2065818 RepID=UPI0035D46FAE